MDKAPVVFLIYNRPAITRKTFESIRKYNPKKLFIVADGPKPNNSDDQDNCQKTLEVIDEINWNCEVFTNISQINLGLKQRVSSGINWVFENTDKAIILEDDCLPNSSFFDFTNLMLERYNNEDKIMTITGNNFQKRNKKFRNSYYFSKYNHCWGWATWKRAWDLFDLEIKFWEDLKSTKTWMDLHPNRNERAYWEQIFDSVRRNKIDSWAYPWTASVWSQNGLTVTPEKNLVVNIGFGEDATHTKRRFGVNIPTKHYDLKVNSFHDTIIADTRADRNVYRRHFKRSLSFDNFLSIILKFIRVLKRDNF